MLLLFAIHAKRRRSLSASASRSRSFSDSGFHFAEISQRSSNYLPAKPTTPLPLWDYSRNFAAEIITSLRKSRSTHKPFQSASRMTRAPLCRVFPNFARFRSKT